MICFWFDVTIHALIWYYVDYSNAGRFQAWKIFRTLWKVKVIISAVRSKIPRISMAIFTKAQTAARWLSGPVIQIGFPRNMLMNLMSTWFVLVASIQQYWMTRSLFLTQGTNCSFRRGQNSGESVLPERELFMRLGGNELRELKNEEFFNWHSSLVFF